MSISRGLGVVMFAFVLGACGEGTPEEPGALVAEEAFQQQEQKLHKTVNPQSEESFATNWFSRTSIRVFNPHGVAVEVRAKCSRYNYYKVFTVAPGGAWEEAWGCEGTTLYIFNHAPAQSGLYVDVTTNS